ncbi:MAG: hypothetical protein LC746_14840 [Acidobacteria bacterium]|nr:hypothetical protein [Acidobacteriota bacterium]
MRANSFAQPSHNSMLRVDDKEAAEKMRRAAEGAAKFEPSPLFEQLIEMRREKPKSFASLSPSTVPALSYYEAAKRRAEMLKIDG